MTTARKASPPALVRAGLYLRISDDRNGDELGVRRQEKLCRELAAARGFEIAGVYVDNDASAYRARRRPGYETLLADVERKAIAAVVAYHPDRLYRHPRDLERFVETVERAGAAVATVTAGELDLATASGRMVARMLGAAARFESEQKAERQKAKHAELAAAGRGAGGGTRPCGFAEDRVTVREDEAALIREAARHVLGGGSLRSLVRGWSARGIHTSTGKAWRLQTLRRMLMSARIAGLRSHRDVVVAEAVWPAIITPEDHEALVAILGSRGRTEPVRRAYLLSGGLARCGRCGAALVARPNERHDRRYVCSRDHGGCGGIHVMAEPLESFVAELLVLAVAGPAFDRARGRAAAAATSQAGAELAEVEGRLNALAERYADGAITVAAYTKATNRLEARAAKLRGLVATEATGGVLRALPPGEEALRSWWAASELEARAHLAALVLESVTIGPAVPGRNTFDQARVAVRWKA